MELSTKEFNSVGEKIELVLKERRKFLQNHEAGFTPAQQESLLAYQVNLEIASIISFEASKNNNDKPYLDTINSLPESLISRISNNEELSEHNINSILDVYCEKEIIDSLNYNKGEYYSQAASVYSSDYTPDEFSLAKDYELKAQTLQQFEDKFKSDDEFRSIIVKGRNVNTEWMENPTNLPLLNEHSSLIKLIPVERISESAAPVLNSLIEFKQQETNPDVKKTAQIIITNYQRGMSPVEDKLRYLPFNTENFYDQKKDQFSHQVIKDIMYQIHNEHNSLSKKYATGEALNSPNHLKSNQMENQNLDKKDETISGFVGKDAQLKEGQEGKLYYTVNLAVKNGSDTEWKNVMLFQDSIPNAPDIKKGDLIKVTGYEKTLPDTNDPNKTYTVFTAKSLDEHKTKAQLDASKAAAAANSYTVTGNLGSDPDFKKDAYGDLVVVNVYVKKEGQEQNELRKVESRKVDLFKDLKKGDLAKITGKDGKPYEYSGKTYTNIVASNIEKVNVQKNEHNAVLIEKVKAGDLEGVTSALKNGANPVVLKQDHYKDLSEKQAEAIKNTISLHQDTQKKSSGVKM